jgi:chromate reductase, NAD(P)H dehydrogenase (quinone)
MTSAEEQQQQQDNSKTDIRSKVGANALHSSSFHQKLIPLKKAIFTLIVYHVYHALLQRTLIPLFNQDLETPLPSIVADLKEKIRSTDVVFLVTPEYNYPVPGVLKNAIDWASRPYGDNAWDGKPVAIMGASIGMTGTSRAQYHLRQMFVFLNMYALNRPEVMISNAAEKFNQEGNLVDDRTREKIREFVQALVSWTIKHKSMLRLVEA